MDRRQLLTGVGALAAGSITFGTGAFTSVRADRTVAVQVAVESQAYLGLEASRTDNGAFATNASSRKGELFLSFNRPSPTGDGTGPGVGSEYEFDDVFRVINRGTQAYKISVSSITSQSGHVTVDFYSGSDPSSSLNTDPIRLDEGSKGKIGIQMNLSDDAKLKRLETTTTVSANPID